MMAWPVEFHDQSAVLPRPALPSTDRVLTRLSSRMEAMFPWAGQKTTSELIGEGWERAGSVRDGASVLKATLLKLVLGGGVF